MEGGRGSGRHETRNKQGNGRTRTDERQAGRKEGRSPRGEGGRREAGAAIAIAAAVVTATASIHVLDYNVVVAAAFPPCANEHYPTGRGPWRGLRWERCDDCSCTLHSPPPSAETRKTNLWLLSSWCECNAGRSRM